jgi:hypothetical protein
VSARRERSALEQARLGLKDVTPGQRYTTLVVAAITVVVLTTGLPDGKVASGTGLGAIPDLTRGAAAGVTATAPLSTSTTTAGALLAPLAEPPAPDPGFDSPPTTFAPEPEAPPTTTTTTTPPTTQPPGGLPVPLPVPVP